MSFIRLAWQLPAIIFLLFLLFIIGNEYAIARPSKRIKDVAYVTPGTSGFDTERHRLDLYIPRHKSATLRPVVIFIHGGNWDSGSKNIYTFIGRRLAKQGCVAVIINYRLAPNVQVPAMADDCARAALWVKLHIAEYGGDPERIFVMGHSAGGGLAALLATDNTLFTKVGLSENPVKGVILDDPAGLDMYDYLKKMEYPNDEQYLVPFGRDPAVWRAASPLYYVHKGSPPMLIYVGERTYPSIRNSSEKFRQRLMQNGVQHTFTVIAGKKHVGMVLQLYWKRNQIYRDLLKFVKAN
ncbi:alpha/beta hydrolase [Spirosoma sp. KUDC1026]|uniref:alpha/beta hydrolase n=1 Tax=Spirosoma sp. KUDC1026 TaxID=2745947 RepID=UPI00159BA273|nr:alpha/beta hydrolase [Spirosoma sp. KUDC1026]QKZ13127.1 alpha/beta hydrolase [Spirosoma sp. KUDC1026]